MIALFVLPLPAIQAASPDPARPLNYASHYYYGFVDQGALILGSADSRYGVGVGLAFGRPERALSLKTVKAQLVYEAYYDQTASLNFANEQTYAAGVLGSARWFWPRDKEGRGMFAEVGFGFQYANKPTYDLDTRLNSTPIAGFGGLFPIGNREFTIGLRWLHISNAGTDLPNRGENEFLLILGVRL